MDLQACGCVFLPSCNSCFINALNFAFFITQTTVKTKKCTGWNNLRHLVVGQPCKFYICILKTKKTVIFYNF